MSREPVEFYRDEHGRPRARGVDTQLAAYLETDCQSSTHFINELLGAIESGERTDIIGNAHELTLDGSRATITALHDDRLPERHLSTHYLRDTLRGWLNFVTD